MFFTSYYTSSFKNLIEPFEFFIGLISALAHDLNHSKLTQILKYFLLLLLPFPLTN